MGNRWSSLKKLCCCSSDGTSIIVDQPHQHPPSSGHPQSPPTALPTLQDRIKLFKETADTYNIDALIQAIDQLLKFKLNGASSSASTPHIPSGSTDLILNFTSWTSATNNGATFLKFVNEHTQKIDAKGDFFRSGQGQKVVEEILQQLGQLHWVVGGLSIIAYLLNKVEKVSENRSECLQLLKSMFDLANHIKRLKGQMPEEDVKLRDAFVSIVEGCMTCASQLHSGKFFRFLKSSVNSQALDYLNTKINRLYQDLTLDTVIDIKKDQPRYLPMLLPQYPQKTVGLEGPIEEVKKRLDLQATEVSSRVVVIYGFGGIGKTTLANALVATLAEDLKDYNYTKVEISEDPARNDVKKMQEQILRHCFPTYQHGNQNSVNSCEDGRNHMTRAFNCETNKPVFILIDNALRSKDLEELLPEDLRGLPQRSRILVTTRNLAETDVFENRGILRHSHLVYPLEKKHALSILCKDPAHLGQIGNHVEEILRIAGGIPLVLEIVGASMRKQKYKVDNCSQILHTLRDGGEVKKENLSERLVHSVYKDLEPSTQEAFLDICFFFNGERRRFVEYVVGVEEVKSLGEAALVTFSPSFNSIEEMFYHWQWISREGEEKLIVHDVIEAKGRSMGESTRIKGSESWSRAAKDQVQGIKGVWREDGECLVEERHLSWLKNSLRILHLGMGVSISARSSETFEKLRYLQLYQKNDCFPMNLEGLPYLSVYEGSIFKEFATKVPQKLKYLSGDGIIEQPCPDVDECSSLKESKSIQAVRNSSLEELALSFIIGPVGIGIMFDGGLHFNVLKILELSYCEEMEELPPQVCGLPSLNRLILQRCDSLKRVPESIANLRALTHLDLSGCTGLEEVCSSLGELTALRCLDLSWCRSLRKLADNFGQLSALEYLSLSNCPRLEELPDNFAQLRSLKGLDLSRCISLRKLPSNFVQLPSLQVLRMRWVEELLAGLVELGNCKIII